MSAAAPVSASSDHAASSPLIWGLAVATTVSWGILFYTFTLFLQPMEMELGWSRAELNTALSVGLLASGLAAIPAGQWIDRHGGRLLMSAGALAGALLLLAWAWVDSFALFIAIWLGIGIAQALTLYEPVFAVITANVRDYRRAILFVSFLGGLASTIFLPLTHWLIEAFGWRTALLVLAAIQLVFSAGVYLLALRGTHGSLQRLTAEEAKQTRPLRKAMRRPAFWGLTICFSLHGFLISSVIFHVVPLLTERGLPLATIVAAIAVIGPAQVAGRLILFFIGKDASARELGRIVVILPVVAMIALVFAPNLGLAGPFLFAAIYGVANGTMTIVRGAGCAEILGTAGYGAVSGAISFASTLAKAAGPIAVALIWTVLGGYREILWLLTGLSALAALAFWFAAAERREL